MDIPAQVVFFEDDVVSGPRRKSGIRSHWRTCENNSPCLRLIRLVIKAAVTGDLDICGTVPDVNASPSLRLVLVGNIVTAV